MRANAKIRKVAFPWVDPFTWWHTLAYDSGNSARNAYLQTIALMAAHIRQNCATASPGVLYLSEGAGTGQRCEASIIIMQDLAKNLPGMLSQERRGDRIHWRCQLHAD